ncbi:lipolytic protein G-D-S-L [Nocardioides sp. ChNu-153]|uniref:SGNH/GDSL hydrolase family protein n=1 Tax=Nocardioides sp. ChNu-153 TaxID=2779364 RepID=UPI0026552B49|nr:GDSL-type esterase/lipase family protein [Nocardioides sp. ChNu-153]MDN7120318.1 lipolytic protein G-D-S-L [Nocardioides sp. ChNu-153]
MGVAAYTNDTARAAVYSYRHAECLSATASDEGLRLVGIGDSITQAESGYGVLGESSWYAHAVCDDGTGLAHGRNAGGTNQTSAQILARFDEVRDADPDAVVIIAGTNDLRTGVPTDRTLANLAEMVTIAQGLADVVVIGTVPAWDGTDAAPLNDGIRALATDTGARLVEVAATVSGQGLTVDGTHPTPEGAELVAKAVEEALTD